MRRLFRLSLTRRAVERDVDTELEFHLRSRIEELVARGASPESARRRALGEFGDLPAARAELSAIDHARAARERRADWRDALGQDVRFAARSLGRQPGFLAVALTTLALGIGANVAIFSVVNAVMLRPLPYAEPDRLVRVWPTATVPPAVFEMVREQSRSFDGIAGYSRSRDVNLTGNGEPLRLAASITTGALFNVLGARAMLGRTFTVNDERPGRDPIVVLSHALWRERFHADPNIVGRQVTIDGVTRTVVGVMPADFRFPAPQVRLWMPQTIDPTKPASYWWDFSLGVVARLRPGITPAQARSDVAPIIRRAPAAFPWRMPDAWARDVDVVPLRQSVIGTARTTLLVLWGAVGLVLLIACVNVANLLLVRAASRAQEIAVRTALGAGRGRVVRQFLTESLLLGGLGGVAGLALAAGGLRVLVALLPPGTPRAAEIGIDGYVLAFTLMLALITGAAFGIAPAVRASQSSVRSALSGGTRSVGETWAKRRLSEILVVGQIALGVILVAGAGLLIKSFWRLEQVDPGFRTEHVVAIDVALPSFPDDTVHRARTFYAAVRERIRALPHVQAAALASTLPFGGELGSGFAASTEDHPIRPGEAASIIRDNAVSPDYLRVMGIPLVTGRELTDADREGTPLVGIIDREAAREFWSGEDPIGKRIKFVAGKDWITVVGVAGNVTRDSLNSTPQPSIYLPALQTSFNDRLGTMHIVVRTDLEASAIAPSLRAAVAAVNPNVPVGAVQSLDDLVSASAARPRFTMFLLATFAALALLLGAVGIYGVIAYTVTRRTREIGVRMALGAKAGDVLGMVLREGGRLAALGVGIGIIGALAASRLLAGFLYGVTPSDPTVFISVSLLLGAAALLASLIPALRAARVDPLVALRSE
jgi:predicted permease